MMKKLFYVLVVAFSMSLAACDEQSSNDKVDILAGLEGVVDETGNVVDQDYIADIQNEIDTLNNIQPAAGE